MIGSKARLFAPLVVASLAELVPPTHFHRHLECDSLRNPGDWPSKQSQAHSLKTRIGALFLALPFIM